MKRRDTHEFRIGRSSGHSSEFYLHESCCHDYGRIDSVRSCLHEHRAALAARIAALDAILDTDTPEDAERLLLDDVRMQVDEVTLRAPLTTDRFDAVMRKAWRVREPKSAAPETPDDRS